MIVFVIIAIPPSPQVMIKSDATLFCFIVLNVYMCNFGLLKTKGEETTALSQVPLFRLPVSLVQRSGALSL